MKPPILKFKVRSSPLLAGKGQSLPIEKLAAALADKAPTNNLILVRDRWDDWGQFQTLFKLAIINKEGNPLIIGDVKIGQAGLKPGSVYPADREEGSRSPAIPDSFAELDADFFSVGQDEEYYARLNLMGPSLKNAVLRSLRDVAAHPKIWERFKHEECMRVSLLRSVTATEVEGQLRRLAHGGVRLTRFKFRFEPACGSGGNLPPPALTFVVEPNERPPTNVQVLIGRNGVGKTQLINQMARSLVSKAQDASSIGAFAWIDPGSSRTEIRGPAQFANLVHVSFSAFDASDLIEDAVHKTRGIKYSYVGLRAMPQLDAAYLVAAGQKTSAPKDAEKLARDFADCMFECQTEGRSRRWKTVAEVLEGCDSFLAEAQVASSLMRTDDEDQSAFKERAREVFLRLSSGHKIVLLTLAMLVEKVEEKTLVLMDEPETHLHPPLLSAYVRALSLLLLDRNGVAIVATHSPVVLQEVPRKCVWVIDRAGTSVKVERPPLETFGEGVGELTHAIFRLEVTKAGFYRMLEEAAKTNTSYEAALASFDGQLGAEAMSVLRALFVNKS